MKYLEMFSISDARLTASVRNSDLPVAVPLPDTLNFSRWVQEGFASYVDHLLTTVRAQLEITFNRLSFVRTQHIHTLVLMSEPTVTQQAAAITQQEAEAVLKKWWGYDTFRDRQWDAISSALSGRDTFILASTGAGKSLIFQIPALITMKTVICISPLLSLAQDQVQHLQACGIAAAALNSLSPNPQEISRRALNGEYRLLYISPERLVLWVDKVREMWIAGHLLLVAIDEAHCISAQGHDFRPDYRELHVIRQRCPELPLIAVTATATKQVSQDIIEQLHMRNPLIVRCSMDRPNLSYTVRQKTRPDVDFTPALFGDSAAIVYCLRRADTEDIAEHLRSIGLKAAAYHAKLEPEVRQQVHTDFMCDRLQIVVATNSFGMGISKLDIRTVVYYGVCKTLEECSQMFGRAGRDNMPSKCLLYFNGADIGFISSLVQKDTQLPNGHNMFAAMKEFVYTDQCRRAVLLRYFDEEPEMNSNGQVRCTQCDNCTQPISSNSSSTSSSTTSVPRMTGDTKPVEEEQLFQHLRQWRSAQAAAKRLAPYMVFPDRTLYELARIRPTTSSALLQVSGIGQTKSLQYGTSLLGTLKEYCALHELAMDREAPHSPLASRSPTKKRMANGESKPALSNTILETLRLHQQGRMLGNIAATRGLKESTIVDHLSTCAESGHALNWTLLPIDPAVDTSITALLSRHHSQHPSSRAHVTVPQLAQWSRQVDWSIVKLVRCKFYHPSSSLSDRNDIV